jgi:hypothetical protein
MRESFLASTWGFVYVSTRLYFDRSWRRARMPGGIHLWLLGRYEHVAMWLTSQNSVKAKCAEFLFHVSRERPLRPTPIEPGTPEEGCSYCRVLCFLCTVLAGCSPVYIRTTLAGGGQGTKTDQGFYSLMVAPPEVPRNAKDLAKGRSKTRGQGQYKGRSPMTMEAPTL